jgi:hypothetical protein
MNRCNPLDLPWQTLMESSYVISWIFMYEMEERYDWTMAYPLDFSVAYQ